MQFFKTLSLLATIAATVFAIPQGLRPTTTETITLSPISATATATAISTSTVATPASTGTGIQIINNLDETIYVWSTSNTASEMQTIASGDSYTESWRTNSDGGISIKMATTTSEESVLKFEYTESEDTLWWDLSCINLDKDFRSSLPDSVLPLMTRAARLLLVRRVILIVQMRFSRLMMWIRRVGRLVLLLP